VKHVPTVSKKKRQEKVETSTQTEHYGTVPLAQSLSEKVVYVETSPETIARFGVHADMQISHTNPLEKKSNICDPLSGTKIVNPGEKVSSDLLEIYSAEHPKVFGKLLKEDNYVNYPWKSVHMASILFPTFQEEIQSEEDEGLELSEVEVEGDWIEKEDVTEFEILNGKSEHSIFFEKIPEQEEGSSIYMDETNINGFKTQVLNYVK